MGASALEEKAASFTSRYGYVTMAAGTGVLAYDNQTGVFTVEQVITGRTSGATGILSANAGGVLTLTITGVFQDSVDITMTAIQAVIPASGGFVVYGNGVPLANVNIAWWIDE